EREPCRRSSPPRERAPDAYEDVKPKRERGDVEADRVDREEGEREPEPGDGQREGDREDDPRHRPRRQPVGGRGRRDEQREDEQRAGDVARLRDREAEHEQEAEAESSDRDPSGVRDVGVDRGEEKWPGRDRDEADRRDRDDEQDDDLVRGDAEEGAEEQR